MCVALLIIFINNPLSNLNDRHSFRGVSFLINLFIHTNIKQNLKKKIKKKFNICFFFLQKCVIKIACTYYILNYILLHTNLQISSPIFVSHIVNNYHTFKNCVVIYYLES